MGYNLIVKPLAEQDVKDAVEWYLERNENLPKELIQKITECFERIRKNPEHHQRRYNEVRVVFTEKFPYGIYYTIENTTIYIHAILHTKQNPETGIERI